MHKAMTVEKMANLAGNPPVVQNQSKIFHLWELSCCPFRAKVCALMTVSTEHGHEHAPLHFFCSLAAPVLTVSAHGLTVTDNWLN